MTGDSCACRCWRSGRESNARTGRGTVRRRRGAEMKRSWLISALRATIGSHHVTVHIASREHASHGGRRGEKGSGGCGGSAPNGHPLPSHPVLTSRWRGHLTRKLELSSFTSIVSWTCFIKSFFWTVNLLGRAVGEIGMTPPRTTFSCSASPNSISLDISVSLTMHIKHYSKISHRLPRAHAPM
jgi:hypothetical protein